MRVLLALAFLLWAGSDAHHSQDHNLQKPPFVVGQTQRYEFTLNMTAGIPGLTSQLSKAVIQATVNIRPKSDTEYLLKIENVKASKPESSVSSDEDYMTLSRASQLESDLSKPVKFTLRRGEVESYTLDRSECHESKQIKRSILRHFQVKFQDKPDERLDNSVDEYPYIYNVTKDTRHGQIRTYYTVNVSPYTEFPYEQNVFNISRVESYDQVGYPAFHEHHNFAKQGCPEVCKQQWDNETNKYGAECPLGYEPHHTPLKLYTSGHYNLRLTRGRMVLENAYVEEKHIAAMYDQDMVITISAEYQLKDITDKRIEEPRDGQQYDDLDVDIEPEDEERSDYAEESSYLKALYPKLRASEASSEIERKLNEIADLVMKGDLESQEALEVTDKLILTQKLLAILKKEHLEGIWRKIVPLSNYRNAAEPEKIKRQLMMDLMPLCGSEECIEHIVQLIKKQEVSIWESKEMLISIPDNLMTANERNIKNLYSLLEESHVRKQHLLHSAAHLTLSKVMGSACVASWFQNSSMEIEDDEDSYLLRNNMRHMGKMQYDDDDDDDDNEESSSYQSYMRSHKRTWSRQSSTGSSSSRSSWSPSYECPKRFVDKFIRDITEKLRSSHEMREKVIYIETLCHIGSRQVLPLVAPYVFGTAKEIQSWEDHDIDFLKTVALYGLHNIVGYYPKEMLKYVIPVYFNHTEAPRVRTAAFSVLIRSQPPLSLLQHIAQDSWIEPSNEVGSYVYSTVQTLGNSSEPCCRLTAQRIKLVISQFKSYDIGRQHARSIVRDLFDDLRNFGAQYRTAYTPSNESYVPHSLYASVSYNIQNLKDILWKFAFNIQGIPEEDLLKVLDSEILEYRWPKDIPSSQENQIFGSLKVLPRLPKELRMTIYRKFFYAGDYWYVDTKTVGDIFKGLIDHVKNVFLTQGEIKGHCVKVFIPASYHAFSIGKIAAVPIEFTLKHPLLMSAVVRGKVLGRGSRYAVEYDIKNSVYFSSHKSKHIINPVDHKAYGVYHEQKFIYTLPFSFYMHFNHENNTIVTSFKFPELPKKFLRYESEAGTYVGDVKLSQLPSSDDRDTIRTIPTLFEKEKYFGCEYVMPVHLVSHTEDVTDYIEDVPRDLDELIDLTFKYLRNPGWRRKSINGTMVRDRKCNIDQVTFVVSYNNTVYYPNQRSSSSDRWESMDKSSRYSDRVQERQRNDDDDDDDDNDELEGRRQQSSKWGREDIGLKESDAKNMYENMKRRFAHQIHEWEMEIMTEPSHTRALLRVEYNHTHDFLLHTFMAGGHIDTPARREPYEFCLAHAMKYRDVPNEFEYDLRNYVSHRADFYTALNLRQWKMFSSPDVVAEGSFYKVPHEELFHREELSESPKREWFTPDTHEDCKDDVKQGKPLTPACQKAIQEESIFNRYQMRIQWNKGSRSEIPAVLRNITYKFDHAMKAAFYSNVDINRVDVHNQKSTIEITADYIDKLVDTPLMNVYVQTPEEDVHYHYIDAEQVMPLSGLYRFREHAVKYATNGTYPPTCAIMEKHVTTFDQETYRLPEDKCTYVVSTHCTENKKFVVLAKHVSTSEKEIHVHVESHKIILKPARRDGEYAIEFNGQTVVVKPEQPALLDRKARIHAFVVPVTKGHTQHQLFFHADNAGIYVQYDGKTMKLEVSPLYKGKVCGLCSEFDGESYREYVGPDQCLYTDSTDFAHSCIVDADKCGVNVRPRNPYMCQSGKAFKRSDDDRSRRQDDDDRSRRHDDDDDDEDNDDDEQSRSSSRSMRPKPQTINMPRGEFTCFSTQPVSMCDDESQSRDTQRMTVEFHCLPKYDATTKKLVAESQRRILRELANKSVDFSESISVPRSCRQ